MPKKRVHYTGILAEPMVFVPPVTPAGVDPERPPDGFTVDIWRGVVFETRKADTRALDEAARPYGNRLAALCEHFGIGFEGPGWSTELVWALALRHETNFVDNRGRPAYRNLCQREGVDPALPEADLHLALRLARRHVPGFRFETPAPMPRRFTTVEMVKLVVCIAAVRDHVLRTGGRDRSCVDREIARIICSGRQLEKIVPQAQASSVRALLARTGNSEKISSRRLEARERALRQWMLEMRTAWRAYALGKPTRFQVQLIEEVAPRIRRACRSDNAGQSRSS